jgi:hypothetical protein
MPHWTLIQSDENAAGELLCSNRREKQGRDHDAERNSEFGRGG